jgi:hypothetical protein
MTDFTHEQWKLVFTAVRNYQINHPQSVPCYEGLYNELSQILDALYPYAYSETYLDHEPKTTNS